MKKRESSALDFLKLSLIFMAVMVFFCIIGSQVKTDRASGTNTDLPIVILDAGHGGEDGGAQSDNGTLEKNLNLDIVKTIGYYLEQSGYKVVYTRTEDILLYDRNVDYKGRKKVLDLAARLKIARSYENSVFVSIHMNAFPGKQYSGLQVYYSPHHTMSEELASTIQKNDKKYIDSQNNRTIKAANSSIYLLDRLQTPGALIECGFLSNKQEAELLCDTEYRKKLSLMIAESIFAVFGEETNHLS